MSILASIKTQTSFLPLSPQSTTERNELSCQVTQPMAVITDSHTGLNEQIGRGSSALRYQDLLKEISTEETRSDNQKDEETVNSLCTVDDVAVIVFTSGSSGKPKGVPLTHRNILNGINWVLSEFPYTDDDITLIHNNPSSVASLDELLCPLLTGTKAVIATAQDKENTGSLVDLIEREGVTRLAFCSMSRLQNVINYLKMAGGQGRCPSLRFINVGGEALPKQLVTDFINYFGNQVKLVNTWGMSETSNNLTWECFTKDSPLDKQIVDDKVSIGYPINNTIAYVVDENMNVVEQGTTGQLAFSGASIASGYLQTDRGQSFLPNPILSYPGHQTVLLTGDYGRVANNRLIFEGRRASQVNINGFKVNTLEVENHIRQHLPGIKRSCVSGLEFDKERHLVCFYENHTNQHVSPEKLRCTLEDLFPSYKVPSKIYLLEELPVLQPLLKVDMVKLKEIYKEYRKQEKGTDCTDSKTKNIEVPEVEVRKQEPRLDTFAEKYEMRYELMTLHKRQNYVGPHNKFTKESDEETFQLQNKKFHQIGNSSRLVTRILAFYRSLSDSVSSLLMARLFPKSEIVHSTVNI